MFLLYTGYIRERESGHARSKPEKRCLHLLPPRAKGLPLALARRVPFFAFRGVNREWPYSPSGRRTRERAPSSSAAPALLVASAVALFSFAVLLPSCCFILSLTNSLSVVCYGSLLSPMRSYVVAGKRAGVPNIACGCFFSACLTPD